MQIWPDFTIFSSTFPREGMQIPILISAFGSKMMKFTFFSSIFYHFIGRKICRLTIFNPAFPRKISLFNINHISQIFCSLNHDLLFCNFFFCKHFLPLRYIVKYISNVRILEIFFKFFNHSVKTVNHTIFLQDVRQSR